MFSHEGRTLLFSHFIVLYFYVGKQMVLPQSVDQFTFGTRWPKNKCFAIAPDMVCQFFYSILCKNIVACGACCFRYVSMEWFKA